MPIVPAIVGVDIRWGCSQLRYWVLYPMFFFGFGRCGFPSCTSKKNTFVKNMYHRKNCEPQTLDCRMSGYIVSTVSTSTETGTVYVHCKVLVNNSSVNFCIIFCAPVAQSYTKCASTEPISVYHFIYQSVTNFYILLRWPNFQFHVCRSRRIEFIDQ